MNSIWLMNLVLFGFPYFFCKLWSVSIGYKVSVVVFKVAFNNISVISWWSVLLVEENHWLAASNWPAFSHMLYWIHLAMSGIQITTLVVIGTDCTGSCKSNYHTIMTMTARQLVIYYCLTVYVMKNNYILYTLKYKIQDYDLVFFTTSLLTQL